MKNNKSDYVIVRRTDDDTYDIFFKMKNGKLDFVSNHDTYDEAINDLNQEVTQDYIKGWSVETKRRIRESFEDFYNKK